MVDAGRHGSGGEGAQLGVRTDAETAIHTVGLPVGGALASVGGDESHRGAVLQVAARPDQGEIIAVLAGSFGAHVQKPEVGRSAELTGDANATVDRQPPAIRRDANPPTVEELYRAWHAHVEGAGVLQEERSRPPERTG